MHWKKESVVLGIGALLIVMSVWKYGRELWCISGENLLQKMTTKTVCVFLPEYYQPGVKGMAWKSLGACVWPGYEPIPTGNAPEETQWVEDETTNYEELAYEENQNYESMRLENEAAARGQNEGLTSQETDSKDTQMAEITETPVVDADNSIPLEQLKDFDYLCRNFYIIDASTTTDSSVLDAEKLLSKDMRVRRETKGPQILIYHTHSQERYADSTQNDATDSVVAVGEYLTELLTQKYGYKVLHHTGCYDVNDRDHAYSNAAPALEQLLAENPDIQVVIDLHRDSVREETHLVTEIDGKPTAKIMFFNGLCKTAAGNLWNLQNPYLEDNLALSLQLQLAAAQKYPDFTRRIYLKGYRYNMNYCPKSLLVEVGAQNNTLQEAKNAMEPLADILAEVLQ